MPDLRLPRASLLVGPHAARTAKLAASAVTATEQSTRACVNLLIPFDVPPLHRRCLSVMEMAFK